MIRAAAPRAKISRLGVEWALRGIIIAHRDPHRRGPESVMERREHGGGDWQPSKSKSHRARRRTQSGIAARLKAQLRVVLPLVGCSFSLIGHLAAVRVG